MQSSAQALPLGSLSMLNLTAYWQNTKNLPGILAMAIAQGDDFES